MRRVIRVLLGVLLVLGLSVAGFIGLNWAPDRPVEELKARWAPAPSQFIELMGMQVHLRDEGPRDDAEPLLLLHGTSASLHTWEGWVTDLKRTRRVISVDLPGFGLTGPFPDGDYRIAHYTAFLDALLERLQVPPVAVAGNSFGGQLAWELAVAKPARVSRLILVDAAGYPRQSSSVPIGFRLAQVPALAPLMARLLPRRMIESSVRNVYGDPTRVTDELVERYYQLTLRAGNRQALVARFQQAPAGESQALIRQVRQPTLILWGGRDGLIAPANAERFKADIAGSRLVIFEQLGHVPQEEDPALTLPVVQGFLAE